MRPELGRGAGLRLVVRVGGTGGGWGASGRRACRRSGSGSSGMAPGGRPVMLLCCRVLGVVLAGGGLHWHTLAALTPCFCGGKPLVNTGNAYRLTFYLC